MKYVTKKIFMIRRIIELAKQNVNRLEHHENYCANLSDLLDKLQPYAPTNTKN